MQQEAISRIARFSGVTSHSVIVSDTKPMEVGSVSIVGAFHVRETRWIAQAEPN